MAGCVSVSNVINARDEVVLRKRWSQSSMFDGARSKNLVKEVAFPTLRRNDGNRDVFVIGKQRLDVTCNMFQLPAEPQSSVATTIVTKEGNDSIAGKDVKVLGKNYELKTDSDGNGGDMFDGSGGNGKFNNGGGSGGGGDSDDSEENDQEEKEFGPIMKFEGIMKEVEARGASLPSDMLEAAKSVGIRKVLLLRYLDLQGSSWPLGYMVKSWAMLRNRMLADPSFLFKIGAEIVIDSCCATFAEVQKRGKDFWAEFELYVADLLVGMVVNVALVGMLAPYVRIGQPSVSKGFLGHMQRAYGALPSSVFEAEGPGCRFSVNQRIATYFYKVILCGSVGFGCGIIGQGIANLIMTAKRSIKKSEEDIPVPPLLKSAAFWGVFLGASSKTRYQIINGPKRLVEASQNLLSAKFGVNSSNLVSTFPEDIPGPPLLKSATLSGVFLAVSSNTRYQIINGLERLVEASATAKQVPPVAMAFTVGVRFANNVYGGMQFVDWARWCGVQ